MEKKDYQIIEMGGKIKLMIFKTGKFYSIIDDVIKLLTIKSEVQVHKKTFKIYRTSYLYFNNKKLNPARIIATAFVENPNSYKKIKRKNPDIFNNSSSNIEWVSDNKDFSQKIISIKERKAVNYDSLCEYNKIIYEFLVNKNEIVLHDFIYKGKFRRYLYKAFYDRGLPDSRFDLFLDTGYDILKDRLTKYYSFRINRDNQARKYIYITMYMSALSYNVNTPLINLEFIPRELRNSYQNFEENYLEEIFSEDFNY